MGDQRLDNAMQEQAWDRALQLIEKKQGLRHTDTGWSVLHTAVWKDAPPRLCEALIWHIDVNKPDDLGDTPVHYALRFNVSPDLLKALLKGGGDPNRVNLGGHSPLILGVFTSCSIDLLLVLLSFHADPNLTDDAGRSAMDWARFRNNHIAQNHFIRVQTIVNLVAASLGRRSNLLSIVPLDLFRKLSQFL